jgi:kynureninase
MKNTFDVDPSFAEQLDRQDPLASYRNRFYIPHNAIYMLGNSLGLLCKDGEKCISRIVDEWRSLGIKGWLAGEQPWFTYAEELGAKAAGLMGAKPEEVVATGTTTVNIHSLVSTLYKPAGKRTKILADELNFPTDIYALRSEIRLRGLDPGGHLMLVRSEDGHCLDEQCIIDMMTDDIAIALLPSVLYRSGQLLDMQRLSAAAHERGILIGFDCSHSAGVVPHRLDDAQADFAVWCSYKYMNGGPGGVAFLYLNEKHFHEEPGMAGWFGYIKEKQFDLSLDFEHAPCAGGMQISSPGILAAAALEGSLDLIIEAGIEAIRDKSVRMTSYFIFLAEELLSGEPYDFDIVTPREADRRGGHVALSHASEGYRICEALKARGVIGDFRPPSILRFAPAPLYTSYTDVRRVVQILQQIIDRREYETFSKERDAIT